MDDLPLQICDVYLIVVNNDELPDSRRCKVKQTARSNAPRPHDANRACMYPCII
eukprot:XP_001704794.1 Hypothetical protein GL50803_114148 [Giardia lamblia ATCC 50803]